MKLPLRHKRKTDCVAKLQKGENNKDLDYKQMYFSTKIVDHLIRVSILSAASDEAAKQEDTVLSLATLRSRDYDYEFPHHRRYHLCQKTNTVWAAFFCRVIYCDRKSNKAKTLICGTVAGSSSVIILSIVQIKQRSEAVTHV